MEEQSVRGEVNDNDRLMAALSYVISILALVILLSESMRERPFQKYHAVQALAANVALGVVMAVLATVTLGFGACLIPLAFVPLFYWAYQAYQGEWLTIPWLTDFCQGQGWLP